jgi:hypothetical protein
MQHPFRSVGSPTTAPTICRYARKILVIHCFKLLNLHSLETCRIRSPAPPKGRQSHRQSPKGSPGRLRFHRQKKWQKRGLGHAAAKLFQFRKVKQMIAAVRIGHVFAAWQCCAIVGNHCIGKGTCPRLTEVRWLQMTHSQSQRAPMSGVTPIGCAALKVVCVQSLSVPTAWPEQPIRWAARQE